MSELKPDALIDAILAKEKSRNNKGRWHLSLSRLGPGFDSTRKDVDYVVETQRGHNLARVIDKRHSSAEYRNSGDHCRIWKRTCDPLTGCRDDTQLFRDR